jgi:hypothetical protein
MKPFFLVIFAGGLCAIPSSATTLFGETIEVSRQAPAESFTTGILPYTVGTSAPVALSTGNNLSASATATDLIVNFGPSAGSGGGIADQFILFDALYLGTGATVTGFTIVTNTVPGIVAGDISFAANSVTILIGDANWDGGQVLDIALQNSSATPEPAAALFVFTGIGLIAARARWRRQS